MRQIYVFFAAAVLVIGLSFASHPAFAQNSPSGSMRSPTLQPQAQPDETLPPALPGAGDQQNLSAAPSVAKTQTGDPTAQLFTAINAGDYSSAQDAVSRGADLNAQNSLGETPLDLSVGLNRNSITFMLLAARNDSGDNSASSGPGTAMPSSFSASAAKTPAVPVKLIEPPNQPTTPGNNPGTPNASAGFLGFGN